MKNAQKYNSPQKGNEFLSGVHCLRGIAALLVVVFHAGGVIGLEKYQHITSISRSTAGLDAGVDLFFVISGFVISLPFFRGKNSTIPTYIFNRILRIYPLSITTAVIFIGSAWLLKGELASFGTIASSILLIPNGADPLPIVLWTLKQEILFYIIFSSVYKFPRAGFYAIFAWGGLSLTLPNGTGVLNWLFNRHNVEFLFGIIAAYLFIRISVSRRIAINTAAVAIVAFIALSYLRTIHHLSDQISCLTLGSIAAIIILSSGNVGAIRPRTMLFLGSASYSIYLIHFLFVSIGNKVLFSLAPSLPGIVALIVLTAFSTTMGGLYFIMLERPLEKWRHRKFRPIPQNLV